MRPRGAWSICKARKTRFGDSIVII
jgi:hypothetical protein